MKLSTFPQAPSPRRVHRLLAEKGLQFDQQFFDIHRRLCHGLEAASNSP